jgi:hypothetical protein
MKKNKQISSRKVDKEYLSLIKYDYNKNCKKYSTLINNIN